MFGIVGLADCVNILLGEKEKRYGHDEEADDHFMLHAQVGMDYDEGVTAGVRIPVGDEPENMSDHLRHSARFHKLIPTGCSDIFAMETTARNNPMAMLDVLKGAFLLGVKYISFYEENSDLIMIITI